MTAVVAVVFPLVTVGTGGQVEAQVVLRTVFATATCGALAGWLFSRSTRALFQQARSGVPTTEQPDADLPASFAHEVGEIAAEVAYDADSGGEDPGVIDLP